MSFFNRRRFFSCLKPKRRGNISLGSYGRDNDELSRYLPSGDDNPAAIRSPTEQERNRVSRMHLQEWTMATSNHSSRSTVISIISATPGFEISDVSTSQENQQTAAIELDWDSNNLPPSYGSLFYYPPPKYEDVVTIAHS